MRWNLFWLDLAISSSTWDWIQLTSFLSTHSATVVSSRYFHSFVLLALMSSIMRTNSHVQAWFPAGTFLNSDKHVQDHCHFHLYYRYFEKGYVIVASTYQLRKIWKRKLEDRRIEWLLLLPSTNKHPPQLYSWCIVTILSSKVCFDCALPYLLTLAMLIFFPRLLRNIPLES